jgi:copper chaperone
MKSYVTKFKQENLLCHKCLTNVVKSLSELKGLEELNVDINSQKIKVVYKDKTISKDDIKYIVNESILSGKVVKIVH